MKTYWNQWNQEFETDYTARYSVIHRGAYYANEIDDSRVYTYDYESWGDAQNEYNGLVGVGMAEVAIRDNEYGVMYIDGEWR